MGFFRFRRSFKLLPGIRMNLGKRGASFTIGGKGFKTTISGKRRTTTVGIPGTGLSYTTTSKNKRGKLPPPLPTSVSIPSALPMKPTSSPPSLPGPPKQRNYGNWLAVFFACVAAISIFGRCSSSPNNAVTTTPEPAKPVVESQTRNAALPPVEPERSGTPAASAALSSSTSASTLRQTMQAQAGGGRPKISIEHFKPNTVKLTQDVDMPLIENKKYIGSQRVHAGTVVNLKVIKGDSVIVEYKDGFKLIPVPATDLLDQMVAAVGD